MHIPPPAPPLGTKLAAEGLPKASVPLGPQIDSAALSAAVSNKFAPTSFGEGRARDANTASSSSAPAEPLHMRMPMPRFVRRALVARIGTASPSPITHLKMSWDPRHTLRALREHQWKATDAQYILLALIGIFSLCMIQNPGPIVKFIVASALLLSLVFPITRQFFIGFLPIGAWLFFFLACGFVPAAWRPPIWVRVLPTAENILYGANISNILSRHTNAVLDVLAWLPYGIIHFGAPFIVSLVLFIFAPPGSTRVFAVSFGYMNVIGVVIQLLFPCAPPWYENMYGLAPASYDMPGSPGGLARIDKLFGTNGYTSTFTASPMVFGAFPSLHSGSAITEALFLSHAFPRLRPVFWTYVLWIWWSTMYLTHHYFVDLVGGGILAVSVYYFAELKYLPQIQPNKILRWEYDYVLHGSAFDRNRIYRLPPLQTSGTAGDEDTDLELAELGSASAMGANGADVWSVGSSTSRSISPVDGSGFSSVVSDTDATSITPHEAWDEQGKRARADTPDIENRV